MLRSFRALAHSVAAASACTRTLSHGTRVAFSVLSLPKNPLIVRDPVHGCRVINTPNPVPLVHLGEAVKYSDSSDTIAEHLRSLIILPESSFASYDTGNTTADRSLICFCFLLTGKCPSGISDLKLQKRTYQVCAATLHLLGLALVMIVLALASSPCNIYTRPHSHLFCLITILMLISLIDEIRSTQIF
jgi:hypothetical protein